MIKSRHKLDKKQKLHKFTLLELNITYTVAVTGRPVVLLRTSFVLQRNEIFLLIIASTLPLLPPLYCLCEFYLIHEDVGVSLIGKS